MTKKKRTEEISRRDFLKDASILVGGAAIGSTVLLAACAGEPETETVTNTQTQTQTNTVTQTQTATVTTTAQPDPNAPIEVLNPEGPRDPIELQPLAPRLDTLEGKTIYIADVNFTGTWQFTEELEKLFKERFPNTTFVRKIKQGSYAAVDEDLWAEVEANADGWVMGTGH